MKAVSAKNMAIVPLPLLIQQCSQDAIRACAAVTCFRQKELRMEIATEGKQAFFQGKER